MKTTWTWEEWQQDRAAKRAATDLVSPNPCRRPESSSDKRLRAAYDGERGPNLHEAEQGQRSRTGHAR